MVIGIKTGTFVILHSGHIECFRQCKSMCDKLIVLINNDDYILRKKGCIPMPAVDRKIILESIKYIDEVHIFDEPTEDRWIAEFKKSDWAQENCDKLIVFHSSEYANRENVPGINNADEIIYIYKGSKSTSNIFEIIRNAK